MNTLEVLHNKGQVISSHTIPFDTLPANTVCIDKGSLWATPFIVGVHGSREECLVRYNLLLAVSPDVLEQLDQLKGKDLICSCNGSFCHGETLVYLASIPYSVRLEWAEAIKAKHSQARTEPLTLCA